MWCSRSAGPLSRFIPYFRTLFDADEGQYGPCLLYTSDAADERSSVDLGGRRIIKKKTDGEAGGRMNVDTKEVQSTQTIKTLTGDLIRGTE